MSTESQLPARLASPGETFEYADAGGELHTMTADDQGRVQPTNGAEDRLLAERGFPRIEADPEKSYRDLQAEAKDLGLSSSGSKADLTAAIAAERTRLEAEATQPANAGDDDKAGSGPESTEDAGA